jgi:Membrane bound FAD containing D-sorbitol dehydrogenase
MAKKPNQGGSPMLKDFIEISRILTGVEALDAKLGNQYLDRLTKSPFDPFLREILHRFRGLKGSADLAAQVKAQIVAQDTLRPTIGQIILLWYTSAMQDAPPPSSSPMHYGTQEEYFSGLVWSILGAHVPGLSGGYFGHWRYPPDNEPSQKA